MSAMSRMEDIAARVKESLKKDFPTCAITKAQHGDWPGGLAIRLSNKEKFASSLTFELFEMPTCCAILVLALLTCDRSMEKQATKVLDAVEAAASSNRYTQIIYNEANGAQDKILNDAGYKCRAPFKSLRTGSVIRTWISMLK